MVFNFSWLIEGRVGGMGRPRDEDAAWLREQGVTAIVSLTESAPELDDIEVMHVPVPDMTSPTLDQVQEAVDYMNRIVGAGGSVVAHCGAGMGRTGTVLAAYLVRHGMTPELAIEAVRALRPGSIETEDQEAMIFHYAEVAGGSR